MFDVPFQTMGDPDPPPTGQNGDDSVPLWWPQTLTALYAIGSQALDAGGGTMISFLTKPPVYSHQYFRSAVKCALREDQAVRDPITGETYRGWWGLADGWLGAPLTLSEQRWVSACMIQKLNAFEEPVPILLEGAHAAIEPDSTLQGTYNLRESTAFGNLFLGPANSEAYVCWEDDLANACGDPAQAMSTRICDTSSTCNLTNLGVCGSGGGSLEGGLWDYFDSYGYTETIRVRLKTEDASCYILQ
ncbi:hypothetical protein [Polyangium spumosum]|nr:hypothetical protein [Polyangium spumosum]